MSHCAPEATLKPIRLKFTPETVVSNVLVAQVCWEAVPNTWPSSSKAPVAKNVLCVRGTVHDLSVDERSQHLGPSETKCMSSVKYGGALPDNDEKTKHASLKSTRLWTWKPVQLTQNWRDMFPSSGSSEKPTRAFWTDWTFRIRMCAKIRQRRRRQECAAKRSDRRMSDAGCAMTEMRRRDVRRDAVSAASHQWRQEWWWLVRTDVRHPTVLRTAWHRFRSLSNCHASVYSQIWMIGSSLNNADRLHVPAALQQISITDFETPRSRRVHRSRQTTAVDCWTTASAISASSI